MADQPAAEPRLPDPQALSRNLAKVAERSHQLMSDFLRRWTVHWPSERLLKFSKARAGLHWLVRIPLLGKIADRCWPGSVHPDYEWRVLDTFDWYSPVYQFKHTWEEVKGWYEEAGFEGVTQLEFPVSGYGLRRR